MIRNWILLLTLFSVGCVTDSERNQMGADYLSHSLIYYQDERVDVCYAKLGDNNPEIVAVDCNPKVLEVAIKFRSYR